MNKIAIISDVHGNLKALEAVFKDISDKKIDNIYCLGDIIAKGTHQHECIKLIKEKCSVVLRGNCDEYFSKDNDLLSKDEIERKRIIWNKSKLTDEDRDYLLNLPYCEEFYMSGRLIRLFHSHPEDINKFIGNIDSVERLYELFLPSYNTISKDIADIVIYGHIHTPFMQKIYNRTIINVGSVGNAIDVFRNDLKDADVRNTTVANYVILSGEYGSEDKNDKLSYEFINVPYDIEEELKDNEDNIELDSYIEEIKKGKYRDMNKIYESFKLRGIDIDKI